MTRIYWDSMLFIYLFDRNPQFFPRVRHLFAKALERGDELTTSYLAMGEVLTGAYRQSPERAEEISRWFDAMGVRLVPFESAAARVFGALRANSNIKSADAIHLASAAAHGVDVFLTNDASLLKMGSVDGIRFIASMHTDLF